MAEEAKDEAAETGLKTYYLKAGAEHSYIKEGNLVTLSETNDELEMSKEGYAAFKDKFNDAPVKVAKPAADDKPAEISTEPADASGKPKPGDKAK